MSVSRRVKKGRRYSAKMIAVDLGLTVDQVLGVFHRAQNVLVEDRADCVDIDGFGIMRITTVSARAIPLKDGDVMTARSHSYLRIRQSKKVRAFLHVKTPGVQHGSPNKDLMNQAWLRLREGKALPGGGNSYHRKIAADKAAKAAADKVAARVAAKDPK